MSYSCSDFTDSIIEALCVTIPDESADSPSDQADVCLAEIQHLQRIKTELEYALLVYADKQDAAALVARLKVVVSQ